MKVFLAPQLPGVVACLVLAVGVVLVAGCGKPTPEKVCARAVGLAPNFHENECVRNLTLEKANLPAAYEADIACLTAARNDDSVFECVESQRRREAKENEGRKAKDVCAFQVSADTFYDDAGNELPPDRANTARDRALADCIAKAGVDQAK